MIAELPQNKLYWTQGSALAKRSSIICSCWRDCKILPDSSGRCCWVFRANPLWENCSGPTRKGGCRRRWPVPAWQSKRARKSFARMTWRKQSKRFGWPRRSWRDEKSELAGYTNTKHVATRVGDFDPHGGHLLRLSFRAGDSRRPSGHWIPGGIARLCVGELPAAVKSNPISLRRIHRLLRFGRAGDFPARTAPDAGRVGQPAAVHHRPRTARKY